jgi:hypothetical protein
VDATFDHGFADFNLEPYHESLFGFNSLAGLPLDADGNFHGGFVIAPDTPRGAHTFVVLCFVKGTHASGLSGRFPFSIEGTTVNDFSVQAQPASGGPGTHVTLHGTGCILDGTPLEEAHVGISFPPPPALFVNLVAQVGPDGNWTTSFTVPVHVAQTGPVFFEATCEAPGTRIGLFDSAGNFTVDSIPPTTTSSTTTSSTTSTTTLTTTPITSLATTPAPQQRALPRTD